MMKRFFLRQALPLCVVLVISASTQAAREDWERPFPGHRVIGNLYAVGTYDLAVFLLTSKKGHVLINTGLENSTPLIRANIESLGFSLKDVKILLTMQAHWDHTAALAEIKAITGAEMWATPEDARVLKDGGFSDAHFGGKQTFKPVKVDKMIRAGDTVNLGEISLEVYEHPGHTEGSSSYAMNVTERGREYRVLIANMGTINAGKRLFLNPTYPGAGRDFAETYAAQKALPVDVWVAAHGSQYGLHDKYRAGQAYDPQTFVDPDGYVKAVERLEQIFLRQVLAEQLEGDQVKTQRSQGIL